MIKNARFVPVTYVPPSRKDIGGRLLIENYNIHMTETTSKLLQDAELFGLTAMGDHTTICKYPLTNVLFAGKCYICYVDSYFTITSVANLFTLYTKQGGTSIRHSLMSLIPLITWRLEARRMLDTLQVR